MLSLEDGVSQDRVHAYKTRPFAARDRMVEVLVSSSALELSAAQDVLSTTVAVVSYYLWQVAHPGQALAAVYAEVPRWGHTATHFQADLKRQPTHALEVSVAVEGSTATTMPPT